MFFAPGSKQKLRHEKYKYLLKINTHKAVTRRVFWVFEHPRNFREKLDTKTDLLLVTKFSKVTSSTC